MKIPMALARFLWLSSFVCASAAGDRTSLVTDRTAVERVYYEHRLGTKPPFEQAVPARDIERLVLIDLKKEVVLKRVYGIEITQAQVETEVKRIESKTRAPEILAEIKKALGNDPARFARTVARPIVVERELRNRFDNDDKLHAAERTEIEAVRRKILTTRGQKNRAELLKQTRTGSVVGTTWQLTSRPANEAAAQPASIPSPLENAEKRKSYFDDLSPELRNVLAVQLLKPGDVSAVIETPSSFLLFVAKEKTAERLTVVSLTIPKQSYDDWLAQQPD